MRDANQLRQMGLGLHNHASAHDGKLPTLDGNPRPVYLTDLQIHATRVDALVFAALLPHIEVIHYNPKAPLPEVPFYLSPADPSQAILNERVHPTSYAANAVVFAGSPSLETTFRDGMSQTIILAQHYAVCGGHLYFNYTEDGWYTASLRRPSFADGGEAFQGKNPGDVHPVADPTTGRTRSSRGTATFQVRPKMWNRELGGPPRGPNVDECDHTLPQALYSSGLLVCLADGSVRTVAPGVSPETFWGAVTPAGGEVLGSDW